MMIGRLLVVCLVGFTSVLLLGLPSAPRAKERSKDITPNNLFARDNLVAWCIVPFDGKKRGPEERAAMLHRLGLRRFAYDWRAEHLPTFDAEIKALKKHDIRLHAVWFPAALNADAQILLDVLQKRGIKTQLWVMLGDVPGKDDAEKTTAAAKILAPVVAEAARRGHTVGLYNHGGWFGEPEHQIAVLKALGRPNVGLVYNLHHGHDHLDRFPQMLKVMRPYLLAVNLNGMVKGGDRAGKKILPLGQGDLDFALLKAIRDSGHRGPIGIIGHTQDDAEARLRDNLDGLDWLVARLAGKDPGPRPKPRTLTAAARPSGDGTGGWLAAGKAEYRTPPLTVECRARLDRNGSYNILVACDTKRSGAHWEIFTMPGSGWLTAYLPGRRPDHVRSRVNVCDGRWHHVALVLEPRRARLVVDGKPVADQAVEATGAAAVPGGLAFGRLVEGGLGCDGVLAWVRLSRGVRVTNEPPKEAPPADKQTIGLWRFERPDQQQVEDRSAGKNAARRVSSRVAPQGPVPPPGNHLVPGDKRLKAVLIHRSPDDAYLAVKADGAGRLFVGGREAVFVFEPKSGGGYGPRQTLLRFPPDSNIIGLELRGNDLYVLTANALYLVPEGRVKRKDLRPRRLLWGLPLDLHVSFHCLAWGPEGDLYLDHGDPLLNYGDWSRPDHWGHWTLFPRPEGARVPYTGAGAVLRVRPDGSGLRVVAGGLRGPVGLAFDRAWNLFTNDNDHESRPDQYTPARLLHVTPHIEFAWPRGWMASKSPDRADLVEPMTAALGRGVPCALAYYDEPFLPETYRRSLLMCRWDSMAVTHYPLRPRGASFAVVEHSLATGANQARPVGIAVGRGGRVFVTCLYLAGNVVVPHCVSDLVLITRADDPDDWPFQPCDVVTADAGRLWTELSSSSGARRHRAHVELLRRGGPLLDEAERRLERVKDDDPAVLHLPWLAGAGGSAAAGRRIAELTRHRRGEVRLQAVRALAEFPKLRAPRELFVRALDDAEPPVRLAALAYFFRSEGGLPVDAVAKLAASSDTYLRQTAAWLLAERASPADLRRLLRSAAAPVRLAGVLAVGFRLTVPPVHDQPPRELPLFYPEGNAFFQTRQRFFDREQPTDLRDFGRVGSYTTAQRWQAVRPTAGQQELFALLVRALDDPAAAVSGQAGYFLGLLKDPRSEALVRKARRNGQLRALSAEAWRPVPKAWVAGPFPDVKGGQAAHPPGQGLIDLSAAYETPAGKVRWQEAAGRQGRFAKALPRAAKGQSSYIYFRLQSLNRRPAALRVGTEDAVQVWHNGRAAEDAGPGPERVFLLDVQPGSNDILVRARCTAANRPLDLSFRAKADVAAALPDRLDSALLARRLREGSGTEKIAPEFLHRDWVREAARGNAAAGRKLFGSLGCVKCHAITAEQKGGGAPSLAEAGKRFTVPYLVESILLPSRQVAEPFRATTLTLTDGKLVTGLVVTESADGLEVLLPDGSRRTIARKDVDDRAASSVSPMPAGLVKTPRELRDLLAYLLSDRPLPP